MSHNLIRSKTFASMSAGSLRDAAPQGRLLNHLRVAELVVEVGLQHIGSLLRIFVERDVALDSLNFDCHNI